ncbi:N-acyl homoserine lactonase family protein [Paenibacillus cellulositrophicus]|uniref:N-acyl homoserine lactonase family protein n=1 Tax=Paenibacillus cellulositrophicus TaxID=562959 RepID=UPI003F80C46B
MMNDFVKVEVLHTGRLKYDRSLAFKELDSIPPVNQRGESFQSEVPLSSYLIEHPSERRVVVDAGWHEDIRTRPEQHLGSDLWQFIEYDLPAGSSVREQLQARGLTPKDIELVVISHLDVDHISGLGLLKGAGRFLVSQPEWEFATVSQEAWHREVPVTPFALEPIPYGPYQSGLDVFGDGLLYLVHTPGHTPGHLSILAKVEKGWLLLASDAGYAERSWQEMILPGITSDPDQAMKSLQWVRDFAGREDCVAALAHHEAKPIPVRF